MAATTIDINTLRKYLERLVCDDAKIAANTTIPLGAITCTNAAGELVNGADAAGLTMQGRAPRRMVNATGAAAVTKPGAYVEAGVFRWVTGGANALTAADLGKTCYILDNQTVVKAAGTVNSIPAGILDALDADGIGAWVRTANC